MLNEQGAFDKAWLDRAHEIASALDEHCNCMPKTAGDIRWPGYLGARYAEKRVLLVAARHNANNLFTPTLREYHDFLRTWSASDAVTRERLNEKLLETMRAAHKTTFRQWARQGVWYIFEQIGEEFGFDFEQVAFTNLALCYAPYEMGEDDEFIPGCQKSFPLNDFVTKLAPQIVFFAKGGDQGRAVRIDGEENDAPVVIRYGNGSFGKRHGLRYDKWIPKEVERVKTLLPDFFPT